MENNYKYNTPPHTEEEEPAEAPEDDFLDEFYSNITFADF